MWELLSFFFGWLPILGALFRTRFDRRKRTKPSPLENFPASRVAIIGGGIGGCSAAYFIRELGGDAVDIHVFSNEAVGGRAAVVEVDGQHYDSGAFFALHSNQHVVNFMNEFGIEPKGIMKPTTPVAFFDGKTFFLRLGTSGLVNKLKLIWRYGFSLIRLFWTAKMTLKCFCSIYSLHEKGHAFTSVPNMLKAIGGKEFLALTQITARDYFTCNHKSPEHLVNELVCSCTNAIYNAKELSALPAILSLACVQKEERFSLLGGTRQLAEKVLHGSDATFHFASVEAVTRVMKNDKLTYRLRFRDLEEHDGRVESASFDVVIIAHPLSASMIEFQEFPDTIYIPVNKSPYQRTVVTYIKGAINPKMFGLQTYDHDFPVDIFIPNSQVCPVDTTSLCMLPLPMDVADSPQNKEKYYQPVYKQPVRTWRIQTYEPLTRVDKDKLFCSIEEEKVVDWVAAFPKYNVPEQFPSFVLDDGMFYINAIEMVTSGMELSIIGAKNVSLLTKDYLMALQ